MPWYKVVIVNNENASWSILGLMRQFILRYKLIGSPKDAVVYRGVNDLARIIHQPKKPTEEDALGSRMMLKTAVSQEHHHPKTSASGCPDTVLTGLTVVIGHNTS